MCAATDVCVCCYRCVCAATDVCVLLQMWVCVLLQMCDVLLQMYDVLLQMCVQCFPQDEIATGRVLLDDVITKMAESRRDTE